MASSGRYHATVAAQQWLRHLAGRLLATDRVPKHLSRPLFLPEGSLHNRWLLVRAVMVLDLQRAYNGPLPEGLALAYDLCMAVELGSTHTPAEWRYLGHCCATASPARLRELVQELNVSGQVLVPRKSQLAGEPQPEPATVARTLATSHHLSNSWLRPQPDILP